MAARRSVHRRFSAASGTWCSTYSFIRAFSLKQAILFLTLNFQLARPAMFPRQRKSPPLVAAVLGLK
jgi:hypothetical protein